jgi:uncharacterized protein (DUF305 family)
MTREPSRRPPSLSRAVAILLFLTGAPGAHALQEVPIVQPGAPGQPSTRLTAEQAVKLADSRYTEDDAVFMRDMIHHHDQAVQMAELVKDRTNRPELVALAGRILASQADEITFMQSWLRDHGESVPNASAHRGMDMKGTMEGMASAADMAKLATLKGTEFDRMFLDLMITHHGGALKMVDELLKRTGSASDPVLYQFTSDIKTEQKAEIARMRTLLGTLATDPRVPLAAGFKNAGQAIRNLALVATLDKPTGFFDPANPAGMPLPKVRKPGGQSNEETEWSDRSPLLSFAQTDLAFRGDVMVAGNYHGFNVYRLPAGKAPQLLSSVVCPGGQGDVSIVGNLLIVSVEQTLGRVDCGRQGVKDEVSAERFRGLRIFDISDPASPRQVGQVQTCRGSHTHSVVHEDKDRIVVYNSGTATVRKGEELAGCVGNVPGDSRTALFRIDVVEIPKADPSRARITSSPAVFADEATGRLGGLWMGGKHGEGTQETSQTDQCHDITVFPTRKLAAGACSGNGIIFDISDPLSPKRIDAVTDPGFAYWHSATFNNDGTKVIFTDEWGGGTRPRCRSYDPRNWGADAIYDIVGDRLTYRGTYKLPAPQTETENCVAHNGSIVPVPGRDIFVQAWYQGGLSVVDFTDSSKPVEIAFFDRGPIDAKAEVLGGYWSTYWYGGRIYGTEIARGLDVFELLPSPHLTANEIAAAKLADQGGAFNPQQQFPVRWPDVPVVARAYMDQLEREGALGAAEMTALSGLLREAEALLGAKRTDPALAARLRSQAKPFAGSAVGTRKARLAGVLEGIAAKLSETARNGAGGRSAGPGRGATA